MQCFYSPSKHVAIDSVNPETGRGHWAGRTIDELSVEYPDIAIWTEADAIAHMEDRYISQPVKRITAERFAEMLDIMPPARWSNSGHFESFHICERMSYSIVSWFVRIGPECFELFDRDSAGREVVRLRALAARDEYRAATEAHANA